MLTDRYGEAWVRASAGLKFAWMLPLLPDLNVPSPPAITQHKLEAALLALGQFQHALAELMAWLTHTEELLDAQKPINGDPKVIEVELAKHHVSAPLCAFV